MLVEQVVYKHELSLAADRTRKIKILIFIGSLRSGGKERRLVELLTYFKTKTEFEFHVVVTRDEVHYQDFYRLNIPYTVVRKRREKNDPTVIYQLYKLCKEIQPDIIHTWGQMQSFYVLPYVLSRRVPLINSQITGAPVKLPKWSSSKLINWLNFRFSTVVLANSKAGIDRYNPPPAKRKVIYNGINLNRFENLPAAEQVKAKYGITTPHFVLMTASFSSTKDYGLFLNVAKAVTSMRDDISFVGVGGFDKNDAAYKRMVEAGSEYERILFPGRVNDVEALASAASVGVLFSTNGEGISNSVMEYMALSKPVIANNAGGMKELVRHSENGYLISSETTIEIAALIFDLIDHPEKSLAFGKMSRQIIEESFTLDKMGRGFEDVYNEVFSQNRISRRTSLP